MKAVLITRPGPPEVLEVRDLPDPQCGPEQVRVRVRAAGSPQEVPGRIVLIGLLGGAHAYMESNRKFGKIVLRVGRDS